VLGLQVRPELPLAAEQLYKEGRNSLKAGQTSEAVAQWRAAANTAQQEGDGAAAAWLCGRAGEALEKIQQWR